MIELKEGDLIIYGESHDYIIIDGYEVLARVLTMSPEHFVAEVKDLICLNGCNVPLEDKYIIRHNTQKIYHNFGNISMKEFKTEYPEKFI